MVDEYVEIPPETLRKAHVCMVEILKEIERVCKKHNITWFLAYGTALGAVRHQGFIPWDDDCDIGMLREDYNKFLQIAGEELSDKFFLQTKQTDSHYGRPMVKIRMNGTKLVEHHEDMNEKYHQGIFVDIFPYDYFPQFAARFGGSFIYMPKLRQLRKRYQRGDWRRAVIGILTAIPYSLHSLFYKIYALLCKCFANDKSPLIGVELRVNSNKFYKACDVLPIRSDITFEGCYFPMMANPEACLKEEYGNYMQLPPVEKRRTHAKLIKS